MITWFRTAASRRGIRAGRPVTESAAVQVRRGKSVGGSEGIRAIEGLPGSTPLSSSRRTRARSPVAHAVCRERTSWSSMPAAWREMGWEGRRKGKGLPPHCIGRQDGTSLCTFGAQRSLLSSGKELLCLEKEDALLVAAASGRLCCSAFIPPSNAGR